MTVFKRDSVSRNPKQAKAVALEKPASNPLFLFLLLLGAMMAFMGLSHTVQAQELSRADYAQCAVYEGREFIGYDSVCLAEKRAAIRYLDRSSKHHQPVGNQYSSQPYRCPHWANGGRGYNATFFADGRPPIYAGTFDATLNGRPCLANPNYVGSGYY